MVIRKFIQDLYKFIHPKFQNVFLDYKVEMKPRYQENSPHQLLFEIINNNRNDFITVLYQTHKYFQDIREIKDIHLENNPYLPVWNNGFLPGLDIITLYTLIAERKPKRFLEVGSGNSTKIAYKARQDHKLDFEIISVDPSPRVEIDELADRIIRRPFEQLDNKIINELEENDILFIDNSHRIFPNSDAMVIFMEVLPNLKKGTLVHFHDIYLPYDYPQFMCDRAYSEQYGLACYLISNPIKYKPFLPNFFISNENDLSQIISPFWTTENLKNVEKHGCSFWILISE